MHEHKWRTIGWSQLTPPAQNNVHLYRISLDGSHDIIRYFDALLSSDEKTRAHRFLREMHGNRFTIARGALRCILGRLVHHAPEEIFFTYGEQGKPDLDPEHIDSPITFNMSHSSNVAVIAIGQTQALGIDIEAHKETRELNKLARRYFSPREVTVLFNLPEDQRVAAFYRCWSSKEAVMKVTGMGLSLGLDAFDVELNPSESPALLYAPEHIQGVSDLHWAEFAAADDISGILAVSGPLNDVQQYDLNPEDLLD